MAQTTQKVFSSPTLELNSPKCGQVGGYGSAGGNGSKINPPMKVHVKCMLRFWLGGQGGGEEGKGGGAGGDQDHALVQPRCGVVFPQVSEEGGHQSPGVPPLPQLLALAMVIQVHLWVGEGVRGLTFM